MASLGQEMKNLRSELQEHRVNPLENPRQPILTKKSDKTPRGFAIIAAPTDTLQAGVERKLEMKKSRKYRMEWWLKNAWRARTIITNAEDLVMYLASSTTAILETDIKLEGTKPIHNSRPMMELHSSTHEAIGVILPETTHSTLVVDDRSINIRISSLAAMMTMTTGRALPKPRREEPSRTLGAIHVLLLVRDEIHSRADSISPHSLLHMTIRYSDDPKAKNPAVLSPMNSASRERMTNLALTHCDSPQRTVQSMHFPTSAR